MSPTSGSINTKFLISLSLSSLGTSIFLQSKSPKARVTANLPRTLPNTIYPPYFLILSCSSWREALWSTDRSTALPFLQSTALASPTLAQTNLFPIINTTTAVAPHYDATVGYLNLYF